MLIEAGEAGVGIGSDGGIVLVVILEGDGVFGSGVPIEIGDGLMSEEVGGAGNDGVFREADGGSGAVGGGDQVLAVGHFGVEESESDRADVPGSGADGGVGQSRGGPVTRNLLGGRVGTRAAVEIVVDDGGEGGGGAVVGEAGGNSESGEADLLVRSVVVLVADVAKELVFDDGPAEGAAGDDAMEVGIFLVGRDIGIGFEEERCGVEGVGAAIDVGAAVELVGAGGGAHVNVGAAGGTLLRVVHAGVDAQLLNGVGGRSGNGLADGEIGRGGGLHFGSAELGGAADAGVVDDARGGDLAG